VPELVAADATVAVIIIPSAKTASFFIFFSC
jgi:hypothetical protein